MSSNQANLNRSNKRHQTSFQNNYEGASLSQKDRTPISQSSNSRPTGKDGNDIQKQPRSVLTEYPQFTQSSSKADMQAPESRKPPESSFHHKRTISHEVHGALYIPSGIESFLDLTTGTQSNLNDINPKAQTSCPLPLFLPECPLSDPFTEPPYSPDLEPLKNYECGSPSAGEKSFRSSPHIPEATHSNNAFKEARQARPQLESLEPLILDLDDDFIAFAPAPKTSTAIIHEHSDSSFNPQIKAIVPFPIKTNLLGPDRKAIKEGKKRARSPLEDGKEDEEILNLPNKKLQTKIDFPTKNGQNSPVKIPDDYLDHNPSEELEIAMIGTTCAVDPKYIYRLRAIFMLFIQQTSNLFNEFSPCPQQELNSRRLFHKSIRDTYQNLVKPLNLTPSDSLPHPEFVNRPFRKSDSQPPQD
ncbi:uncharacterized protein MELLADRAFT_68297 [Melampsora larici-populina 98AG31]|uniref:Uncharacterized protein n=1 Tax=Melampsora larici-populina (strain 98AG31 / pathotype 3-4-7) TaxID=747676 RepID=F4S6A0_MELLP|nr:uncharacterized protein MELLADRAFT_68297 [Melampsora larici-populina 98AG31]EGF99776.1 hypothetical protein MELLADRAFT_68297 [Melampsora larici-populina 98AG31]